MAEKKVHKKEASNKPEPTPQVKKARDMRNAGHSLNEIAQKLKISRKDVEALLMPSSQAPSVDTKADTKIKTKPKKGK